MPRTIIGKFLAFAVVTSTGTACCPAGRTDARAWLWTPSREAKNHPPNPRMATNKTTDTSLSGGATQDFSALAILLLKVVNSNGEGVVACRAERRHKLRKYRLVLLLPSGCCATCSYRNKSCGASTHSQLYGYVGPLIPYSLDNRSSRAWAAAGARILAPLMK